MPEQRRIPVDPRLMPRAEAGLEATFRDEAGAEAELADQAVGFLVAVLTGVGPRATEITLEDDRFESVADAPALILSANTVIGVRAVRVVRAARAVLVQGYENEARAYDRILVELLAHRAAILEDESGEEAFEWLYRRRRFGISKRVAALGNKELYANLSADSHGDPMAVGRLFDPESDAIEIVPVRTPATRASLLMYAGFARDQAVLIGDLAGATPPDSLAELDAGIRAGWKRLTAEREDSEGA